ncbi:cilia- and flagella-associated protein 161 [Aplysia californica]|uniref:Cilia- and flagella-associated protein 161 n=1 Tax=Aplysia californica TaxID=6500 RepID=A0ABM0JHB4_APLCA|nr:cilia- and flagella-associated protein 161 [Aplysia californica]
MAAHVRTYNPSVRVGNWNEDIQLEEDTLKDFLERRANGQLLIQRSSGMMGKMSNPVQLSTSSDGCVRFGDTIMVVNKGNPDRTVYGVGQYPRDDSALAIHMPDGASIDGPVPLCVTGSKKLAPCFRTAFKIMPADAYAKIGDKLRYGQPFSLVTAADGAGSLFLFSDQVLFNRCTDKARHQVVQLVPECSFKTSFQIEHKNPLLRLEFENEPVMANEECIIQHCKTHQNLCVEEKHCTPTLFGNEYEISAHTNLDSHKADLPVNRWMLVMAVAGDPNYPLALSQTGDQVAAEINPSV